MKTLRRLCKELQPSHYDLYLVPDRHNLTFTGRVTMRLKKSGRPSQRLTLHQHALKIESATIVKHDKKGAHEIPVERINNQNKMDEVRIHAAELLYGGEYEVTLHFNGTITRAMTGLYPCFFKHEGKEQVMLATQFESHYAREVFPCIDEPEAKATFQLTLVSEKGLTVLSNTPVKSQEPAELENGHGTAIGQKELVASTFEQTPKMSTYLLAFVIGELHSKSTRTKRGTEVSCWATVAQPVEALDFSLDVAKRSIEFFEDYYGIDYPLPKADHVALPDFSSGAMENWGLITYRERLLLMYPGEASQSTQELIATVVAHETCHQWSGNLVTMGQWDNLWLNESFANLMEYRAVDALFPEWHMWDTFAGHEGLGALRRDATAGVQAVRTEIHHQDEIATLFDPSIVYAKGARLLNMLRTYIGEEAFRKGLHKYFTEHAYQNVVRDDPWDALQEVSKIDVAVFMNPWLERSGFPVISVEQKGKELTLRQAHFLDSGEQSDGRLWPVPLFSHNVGMPERFDAVSSQVQLPSDDFVYINNGAIGHYIVNYTEPAHRAHLVELVKDKSLQVADRLMLLNSNAMLAKAGYRSFGDVLQLLEAYGAETDEEVWGVMALVIAEARRFVDLQEDLEDRIKSFIRELIQREYDRLGWEEKQNESTADKKLRALIIGLGAYADTPAILKECERRFELYKKNPESLSTEIRSVVLAEVVRRHMPGAFDFLVKLHDETANSELQADLASALCLTRDKGEAALLVERLKDATLVRPQDVDHWLVYLLRNRYVRDVAWDWMVDSWSWIEKTFQRDKSYDFLPRYAASACNNREWAEKYRKHFEPLQDQILLKRNIQTGLAEINARIQWLERDLTSVLEFFR